MKLRAPQWTAALLLAWLAIGTYAVLIHHDVEGTASSPQPSAFGPQSSDLAPRPSPLATSFPAPRPSTLAPSFPARVQACRNDTAVEALPEVAHAMRQWLLGHPVCAYCGVSNHTAGVTLNAHHIQTVRECLARRDYAALTASTNFVSLCRTGADDHFHIGHFGNWSSNNPHVLADCAAHRKAQP